MESAVVNARVPVAKRDASKQVLSKLGATTSDLINAAYDFLLEEGTLPQAKAQEKRRSEEFSQFLAATTLDVDWGADAALSYKDILRDGKRADYEHLA